MVGNTVRSLTMILVWVIHLHLFSFTVIKELYHTLELPSLLHLARFSLTLGAGEAVILLMIVGGGEDACRT